MDIYCVLDHGQLYHGKSQHHTLWKTRTYILFPQILFNKAVLDQLKFPYPMFLTTWHMCFATLLTQIMSRTTNMLPGVREGKVDASVMKKQILPVACFFAVSLVLSNKAYIYLSVSYIQASIFLLSLLYLLILALSRC